VKLKDAGIEMKQGDRFKFESPGMDNLCRNGKTLTWISIDGREVSLTEFLRYINYEGKIIKAEPRVLTDDEIINMCADHGTYAEWDREDIRYAAQISHKNGRLERDIELRPAIEAMRLAIENDYCNAEYERRLNTALENIPPL
jgi:hypothetical protein